MCLPCYDHSLPMQRKKQRRPWPSLTLTANSMKYEGSLGPRLDTATNYDMIECAPREANKKRIARGPPYLTSEAGLRKCRFPVSLKRNRIFVYVCIAIVINSILPSSPVYILTRPLLWTKNDCLVYATTLSVLYHSCSSISGSAYTNQTEHCDHR